MNLKIILATALTILHLSVKAQVSRKVLVEHFTNTNCGVCASRNPGFNTNYQSQSGLLRLSIHPSAPYAACLLSKQNVADNDARTNYYGIYGATPRFVIQGKVVASGTNINSSSLFTEFLSKTSPFQIRIDQQKFKSDSIRSIIVIKTVSTHTLDSIRLFVALAEDTVLYASPNGETHHYNVFRKALVGATGRTIKISQKTGDSVVINVSSKSNTVWNFNRIYTVAYVQDKSTKEGLQAERALASSVKGPAGVRSTNTLHATIYPNPAKNELNVRLETSEKATLSLISSDGKTIRSEEFNSMIAMNLEGVIPGLYFIRISSVSGNYFQKLIVE